VTLVFLAALRADAKEIGRRCHNPHGSAGCGEACVVPSRLVRGCRPRVVIRSCVRVYMLPSCSSYFPTALLLTGLQFWLSTLYPFRPELSNENLSPCFQSVSRVFHVRFQERDRTSDDHTDCRILPTLHVLWGCETGKLRKYVASYRSTSSYSLI
jgi:hypothetical protein